MLTEDQIKAKLSDIRELKKRLESQLIQTSTPVYDATGCELTEENIASRINAMAEAIITRYPDAYPLLIGLMDGALPFASKLHDALAARGYPFQFSTMQVSSYGSGMQSGELSISSSPKIPVGDRIVLIIDDVCDTGKTGLKTNELLLKKGAREAHLVTLVNKVQPREPGCDPTLAGFEVSKDAFIIGCGLDYAGMLRNEKSIRAVNMAYLPTPEQKALLDQEKSLGAELEALIAVKLAAASAPGSYLVTGSIFATGPAGEDPFANPAALGM